MPRSLLHSILRAWNAPRRPVGSAARRIHRATIGLESLEPRLALTVAAPDIGLAAASDTGTRGDGITRLTRPVFTGTAPARSSVVVYADGQFLGIAKASVRGGWSLPTPLARPLSVGAHVMTAYSVNASQVWSTARTWSMAVDPTPPTASLSYDSNYRATPGAPVTGRVTVTFSEPVQGVRLSNLLFTDHSSRFTVGLGSPLLRSYVGAINTTQLSDRSYAFTPAVQAFAQGTYTLTLLKTGIVDRAGNPLATGASTFFTIT
jgi:large repetitive protein